MGKQNQNNLGEGNLSHGAGGGGGGEKLFSAFFLSETAIFGKQNIRPTKIKVFSREGTAGMEAVPAPE